MVAFNVATIKIKNNSLLNCELFLNYLLDFLDDFLLGVFAVLLIELANPTVYFVDPKVPFLIGIISPPFFFNFKRFLETITDGDCCVKFFIF